MKKFYNSDQLALPAEKGILLLLCSILIFYVPSAGQSLSLTLSATNNAPNNCSTRTISVSVSGGSGNYAYYWSSEPPSNVYLGNGASITVSPSVATTYTVAVTDNSFNRYAEKSIVVSPLLTGSLSLFIPNAFLEGNLWKVMDANGGTGPLNAYRYELSIIDDWGNRVYTASKTVSTGTTGLIGGEISWNGRLNGTGGYVQAGNYYYDLRLINCSTNKLIRGTLTFFRPLTMSLELSPNPAQDYVVLNLVATSTPTQSSARREAQPMAQLELVSAAGEVLLTEQISHFPYRLNVQEYREDDYILLLRFQDNTFRRRLLIRR